uniref:Uncharacterized protein n=1 Tax=Salmo trutta TaxID=8032 RepID=A0A673W8P0_SALTR
VSVCCTSSSWFVVFLTYLAAIVFLTLQQREPMLKKRDIYEDILEERRNSSDLKYAFGCYSRVLYKGLTPCNANMLKNIVYSDQLRYVINQVSQESGEAPDIIQEEPCVILEEMACRLWISTVHFFAFTLSKVFKTLLQHVCINACGILTIFPLQQAIQEHPVVLLLSHCSYMDFLLMSYILYTYDLALPVIIAAGSMGAEGACYTNKIYFSLFKVAILCLDDNFAHCWHSLNQLHLECFPTVLKEFPHMLSTWWLLFIHSAVQLISNHLNWVELRGLWRPGHMMQHSITLLLGQIALTQPGGVLGHCLVDKTNYSPTKRKPDGMAYRCRMMR